MKNTIKDKKNVESIQIFELLAGLNLEYEQVRVLLLGKDPLPSLNEVYAYIHREERRQKVMNVTASFEKSALVSTYTTGGRGGNTRHGCGERVNPNFDDRDKLKCKHYSRLRHTKDQCWKLMDNHKISLNVPLNEVDLVVIGEKAGLILVDLMIIQ